MINSSWLIAMSLGVMIGIVGICSALWFVTNVLN